MADPLLEPRPALGLDLVANLLEQHYGVTGAALAELHGERDLNYRVDAPDHRRYQLKIHNPSDSSDVVEMRTMAMSHVRRVDDSLPLPKVVATRAGDSMASVTGPDGRTSIVQLFSFLEGRHVGSDDLDEATLFEWGRCVARLGRALRGFFHPAAGYPIQWDVSRTGSLRDRFHLLDGEEKDLVEEAVERFVTTVEPQLDMLRSQVVHNDMNRGNVLIDDNRAIVGITDFGDMTHTALVCDLAVAVAEVVNGRPSFVEMAEPMIAGYCSVTPLEPTEGRLLGGLVAARAATDVTVTAWRRVHHPHATEVATESLALLRLYAQEGYPDVTARLERVVRTASSASATRRTSPVRRVRGTADLLAARRKVLGPLELSYDEPVHLVRGQGAHLFDADGRRYVDAYNNVPVVGHCHPDVADAIAAQATLLVTNTRYLTDAPVELAERLLASAPGRFERVLYVNSGSEANDVAMRIATFATGNHGALVTRFAYHGVTEVTSDLSPEEWPAGYSPAHIGLLTPPGEVGDPPAGVIDSIGAHGHRPAALFVDPVFMSDGILGPAHDWIAAAVAAVRDAGGLFVADEVQAGYGRTGTGLWSIAPSGVEPDFMTLGKPMGNGFPVAAVLGRAELVDPFVEATGYFSTFGGNTLACAAALAVLDVIETEGLVAHAKAMGTHLGQRLHELAARHEGVRCVRAWGLLAGVDLADGDGRPDSARARRVVNAMRQAGVLVGTTGPLENVVKVRPPLVVERADVDLIAERLDDALSLPATT